jgi:hypothetical protein
VEAGETRCLSSVVRCVDHRLSVQVMAAKELEISCASTSLSGDLSQSVAHTQISRIGSMWAAEIGRGGSLQVRCTSLNDFLIGFLRMLRLFRCTRRSQSATTVEQLLMSVSGTFLIFPNQARTLTLVSLNAI